MARLQILQNVYRERYGQSSTVGYTDSRNYLKMRNVRLGEISSLKSDLGTDEQSSNSSDSGPTAIWRTYNSDLSPSLGPELCLVVESRLTVVNVIGPYHALECPYSCWHVPFQQVLGYNVLFALKKLVCVPGCGYEAPVQPVKIF